MASSDRTSPQVPVRLSATLLIGDRLHPVIVLGLNEAGFYAEGVGLEGVGAEFSVEIELPPSAEPSWSPKSTEVPRGLRGAILRARARLLDVENGSGSRPVASAVHARFEGMTEQWRRGLRLWLEQNRPRVPPPSTLAPPPMSSDTPASA